MNLATYRGLVSSHSPCLAVRFSSGGYWGLSSDLIHQLSISDGDILVIHEMPPRGFREWDWRNDSRLSMSAKELSGEIGYFRWISVNSESFYAFEVIKMRTDCSKMGPTERSLRRSCDVPDTVGFGELRGILTGEVDQSRPELDYGTYTGLRNRVEKLNTRFAYLFNEWEKMKDQFGDASLDCETANMIMVRYLKVGAELEKCRQDRDSGQLLLDRWDEVLRKPEWAWDSVGIGSWD